MKTKLLLALLALLGMSQAVAQEYEYVPFVREGVKWVYYYKYNDTFSPTYPDLFSGTVYLNLEIKGDTTINGKVYKKMHKYYGDAINIENDTVPIYLREENKIVYGIVPDGVVHRDCIIGYGPTFVDVDPYCIFGQVWAGEDSFYMISMKPKSTMRIFFLTGVIQNTSVM